MERPDRDKWDIKWLNPLECPLVAETRGMHKAKQAAQHSVPHPCQVLLLIFWQSYMVVVEVAVVGVSDDIGHEEALE